MLPGLLAYDIVIPSTAFTGAVDAIEIVTASTQVAWVTGYELGQSTELGDAQEEELLLSWITGHTTSGSGGGTNTPSPNGHAIAFAGTVEHMNTTIASAGTGLTRRQTTWNVRQDKPMLWDPSKWLYLPQSTRLVLRLPAPNDSVTMTGTIYVHTPN
jgi:hypothetical protein